MKTNKITCPKVTVECASLSTGLSAWGRNRFKQTVMGLLLGAALLVTSAARAGHPELPVDLLSAGDFVILAKTGISTVPYSDIKGDMGVSPIDRTAITGFSLIMDGSSQFSTSAQVTGKIYAADYMTPTPSMMISAISDMESAFTDAAGRSIPDTINHGATAGSDRDIGGLTMYPGLHKWSTGVLISTDVTLDAQGDPAAVFIFQISGDLTVASTQKVILSGGAQAKNIFWQVEGGAGAIIGTYAHFEGIVLTAKAIVVQTGASFNGKLLAQTAVTLDQNNIVDSNLIDPPNVVLEIVSEHGTGLPPVGIYTNDYGVTLTNVITDVETLGGTQYVNTGWSMIGNEPLAGIENAMSMVHTNDAVLTWLWSTNYLLTASADVGGTVTGDTNGFYAADSSVTVTAVPDPGFHFTGWTGDVSGPTNIVMQTMTMDQARTAVAHFALDAPVLVVLEIISEHGTGTPPVGIYTNDYGVTLTNVITDVETLGGTQYVNTGWSMIGNEPLAGITNAMSMVHTNDAVLTWLWSTNYLLTASADVGGTVTGDTNGFYAADSSVTVTAVPDLGFHFTGWTGDVSGPTNNAAQTMTMDQARTAVAHFALDAPVLVVLEIISEHGTGTPPVGIYTNVLGMALTNAMTDVETLGGTQYVNTGWSMIGNEPLAGITNAMSMVHTNDAVLTWLWSTNYLLTASVVGNGSVSGDTNGFYAADASVTVIATPDVGYLFDHWEVNGVNHGSAPTLPLTMDEAKNVVAIFTADFIDVTTMVDFSVDWVFDPRKGYFLGSVTLNNTNSQKVLMAPFWFEVEKTEWHWLRNPTGFDSNTGMYYVDISAAINAQLPGIGNGDLLLDQGESVTVTGIELMGRRPPKGLVVAMWADPPVFDFLHAGGIPDSWVQLYPGLLDANNTLDPLADYDGDGMTVLEEYIAGTNPMDPESFFSISPDPVTGGITWVGQPGRVYTVLATQDLREQFTVVADGIEGHGEAITYLEEGPKALSTESVGAVFYRIEVRVK